MFPKSPPKVDPSLTETMVKVRLEIEDTESETRNPLTSREDRHSIDVRENLELMKLPINFSDFINSSFSNVLQI